MKEVVSITVSSPAWNGEDPEWAVKYKDRRGLLYWKFVQAPDELAAYMQVMGIKKGAN